MNESLNGVATVELKRKLDDGTLLDMFYLKKLKNYKKESKRN